jgi:nicotinamide phosphoribosyltransferase
MTQATQTNLPKPRTNPLLLTDFYKVGHKFQYPPGTTLVYSNLTPRRSRLAANEMVFFGLQYFIQEYVLDYFNDHFFRQPKAAVLDSYRRRVRTALGADLPNYDHIANLHDLGFLPIRVKAVPEGTLVPMRVPCMTLVNTRPEFYWLTNFFETLLCSVIWQPCTSATIAYEYRKLLTRWARKTGMPEAFVQWQAHDFSYRGMSSPESAILSGMAHLTSFTGTDTIPAIDALERHYGADADRDLVGGSVPATEHSVMCAGSKDGELDTFARLIAETYPNGIVSIVSDTWDHWKVLTSFLPALRAQVLARNGKVVIRPDSGDPVKIICGDPEGATPAQRKGVIELLWDVFGGTVTPTGHRLLDSHVGAIYGDSITLERANQIAQRLADKGFASQCVLGVGSFTYQYNTRDTFGLAMKATYVEVNGEPRPIFKDPITDDGTKKSATGLLRVNSGVPPTVSELVTWEEEQEGLLQVVFEDGKVSNTATLAAIRARLNREVDACINTSPPSSQN